MEISHIIFGHVANSKINFQMKIWMHMQRMKIINIKKTYSNFYLFQYVDILCLDLSFSPDIKIAQSDTFVVENVKKLYQQGPFHVQ